MTLTPPDWQPRLVAMDVDGTMQEPGEPIQPPVRAAIGAARAAGAVIVLATGRSAVETAQLAHDLEISHGYAICSNGAVTIGFPGNEVLDMVTFDAGPVLQLVLPHVPAARIAVEEIGFGYAVTEQFPDGELLGPQRLRTLEEMLTEPVTRVIVRDPDSTVADFVDLVGRLELSAVSYAVGYRAWLDLMPTGVNKGSALAKLAATLGLGPADCLAVGDGRNDVDMLVWAGRGVAMGQAPPEVRAIADAVTDPVTAHGAATELRRWYP